YCHAREDVLLFVPGRIRQLKETGQHCQRPPDFRIADYLDGSFRVMRGNGEPHQVPLRFTPQAARYVREKVWHPSQQLEENAGGNLIVTLWVSHLLEVKRWALSWGADCEVLQPKELREMMKLEVSNMGKPYQAESRRTVGGLAQ